jgi:hypothetical protein
MHLISNKNKAWKSLKKSMEESPTTSIFLSVLHSIATYTAALSVSLPHWIAASVMRFSLSVVDFFTLSFI